MSQDAHQQIGWRFGLCPTDADPARFGPFAPLVALWQVRRAAAGADLPARGDFDFYDLKGWHGRVFIARIERDPFALRFTLWGTVLTEWWNVDYTGKTLGEASENPELWQMSELSYFRRMDRTPFIGLSCGTLTQHKRGHIKVMGLDLPLGDETGLTHVLAAHTQIGVEETPETLLPDGPVGEWFRE